MLKEAIARIEFTHNGETYFWFTGVDASDNERTLRTQLRQWKPAAEFAGFTIRKVDPRPASRYWDDLQQRFDQSKQSERKLQ